MRRSAVAAALRAGAAAPVDLVLADPPYEVEDAQVLDMLAALATGRWIASGSMVVVERSASGPEIAWPDGWTPWRTRRYGDTRIEFAQRD